MIWTKSLWKKGKRKRGKKKKPDSLCLILETYIMLTLRAGGQMVEAHTRHIKSIWNPLALLIQHSSCLEGKTISTQMPTNHSDSVTNWETLSCIPEQREFGWFGPSVMTDQREGQKRKLSPPPSHTYTHTHTHTHTHMHAQQISLYSDWFLPLESDLKWNSTWKAPSIEPAHRAHWVSAIPSEEEKQIIGS